MSRTGRDFLYLIWKDPRSRRNYTVGKLSRGNSYTFEYCKEYREAMAAGWELLKSFPEVKTYESPTLFVAFSSRLPDPKRRDIKSILMKYDLAEYDGYELLRRSSGRLPIDTYEFIDPIFPEDQTIEREFYIVGIRHNADCCGRDCDRLPTVKLGEELKLRIEPENESDSFAVMVLTRREEMLGYVPRYYSESVSTRLGGGMTYSCVIIEVNREANCADCLRVRLEMPRMR